MQVGDLNRWEHLKDIELPRMPEEERVEMLIGQDCPEVLMPLEVRRPSEEHGAEPAPYAIRTLFGWTISGLLGGASRGSTASVSFISSTLERQVEQFWRIEGAQLNSDEKGHSVEDQRALDVMCRSIKKEDGHYSVAIPFKEDCCLPQNNG